MRKGNPLYLVRSMMIEHAYDKDAKMLLGYPKLKKLGAVSPNGE